MVSEVDSTQTREATTSAAYGSNREVLGGRGRFSVARGEDERVSFESAHDKEEEGGEEAITKPSEPESVKPQKMTELTEGYCTAVV